MGLPPWETSGSQFFALITGANSGLGYSIAARMVEDFLTSPTTPSDKHLILILCTRTPLKTRFTISRLRAHLRVILEYSQFSKKQTALAKSQGVEYKWETWAQRVTFLGMEVDLCDLRSVYALTDRLLNGTIGSPDATTAEGRKLPVGSPGTASYSKDVVQDMWALSERPGSTGAKRSWGWGLSGIKIPRLDAIVCSAGIGGWRDLDWWTCVTQILLHPIEQMSRPTYKLTYVGATVKSPKGPSKSKNPKSDEAAESLLSSQDEPHEPPLGNVFCANIFGHYILSHELTPLLSTPASVSSKHGGKIIWTSSLEPTAKHLDLDDFQGLESLAPYENSKRIMDLLALTSELPSVKKISASFYDPSDVSVRDPEEAEETKKLPLVKPTIHITQPGLFVSEIFDMNIVMVALWTFAFYVARWVGSPWHTIVPEKAAVSSSWLALVDEHELEKLEGNGLAKAKWGSATDASGNERVMKTEVPGWGYTGTVGEEHIGGENARANAAVDCTEEDKVEFEIMGGKVWAKMEELRKEWKEIAGVKIEKK